MQGYGRCESAVFLFIYHPSPISIQNNPAFGQANFDIPMCDGLKLLQRRKGVVV